MRTLYGEGSRAFLRLQEEIMKESDNQSLFAWIDPPPRRPGLFIDLLLNRFFSLPTPVWPCRNQIGSRDSRTQ